MQQWVPTYKAEIEKQRQHLRNNMSEAAFRTWHAQTLSVLGHIPGIGPLQDRFSEVMNDNAPFDSKVRELRRVLTAVIQLIESPLFGTSRTVPIPSPQASGVIIMPQMTQVQQITQPISLDLDALLSRVDQQSGLSHKNKEMAKSLVRQIWEQLTGRAGDSIKIIDIAMRLANLGINVQQLLGGL